MSDSLLGPALSYSRTSVDGTLQPALLILTQTHKEAKNLNQNLDTLTALNSSGIKTTPTINKDTPQTENTTKCFPDEGLMSKMYEELLKLNKPSSFLFLKWASPGCGADAQHTQAVLPQCRVRQTSRETTDHDQAYEEMLNTSGLLEIINSTATRLQYTFCRMTKFQDVDSVNADNENQRCLHSVLVGMQRVQRARNKVL